MNRTKCCMKMAGHALALGRALDEVTETWRVKGQILSHPKSDDACQRGLCLTSVPLKIDARAGRLGRQCLKPPMNPNIGFCPRGYAGSCASERVSM